MRKDDSGYKIKRNYRNLGKYLSIARKKANLTQKEVSDALEYSSPQYISNFERGIAVPPLKKLKAIVNLYQIKPNQLIQILLKEEAKRMERNLE